MVRYQESGSIAQIRRFASSEIRNPVVEHCLTACRIAGLLSLYGPI